MTAVGSSCGIQTTLDLDAAYREHDLIAELSDAGVVAP